VTILRTGDPVVDLPAVDLCQQILAIHSILAQSPSLEPGPVVNESFAELVRLCEYRSATDIDRVLNDPRIKALTPQLRQLCATGEFLLERSWAHRIIGAADPDTELASFPYRANYEELTRLEMHALAGVGLDLNRVRRVCFLGGGPLPLSAMLISRTLSAPVDVVDVSGEAIALATLVAERAGWPEQLSFHHADAGDFDAAANSDLVVLAALVGLDRAVKYQILSDLSARMRSGSMLVVRSARAAQVALSAGGTVRPAGLATTVRRPST
jgi:nicotianamine synthase